MHRERNLDDWVCYPQGAGEIGTPRKSTSSEATDNFLGTKRKFFTADQEVNA